MAAIGTSQKTQRHPSDPPAIAAIAPTEIGAIACPIGLARPCSAKTRPRISMANESASSALCTGRTFDCPSPVPMRATNIQNDCRMNPVTNTIPAHAAVATATTPVRRPRSAAAPIGIAPSTNIAPAAPPIAPSTASLIPSDFWMSGASTPRAARSNSSTTDSMKRMTNSLTLP
jgi:hypothetical protein